MAVQRQLFSPRPRKLIVAVHTDSRPEEIQGVGFGSALPTAESKVLNRAQKVKLLVPATKALFLTFSSDEANFLTGMAAGTEGYLLKTIVGSDIAGSVIKVHRVAASSIPRSLGRF